MTKVWIIRRSIAECVVVAAVFLVGDFNSQVFVWRPRTLSVLYIVWFQARRGKQDATFQRCETQLLIRKIFSVLRHWNFGKHRKQHSISEGLARFCASRIPSAALVASVGTWRKIENPHFPDICSDACVICLRFKILKIHEEPEQCTLKQKWHYLQTLKYNVHCT